MKLSLHPSRRSCHAGVGVAVLVGLSLCLCALVVFQWVVQSRLRSMVETERAERSKVMGERQDLESRSARYAEEIKHIEETRTRLEAERSTNAVELKRMKGELLQLRSGYGSFSNLALGYSNALVQANSNLVVQNSRMKDLAASANKAMEQRNETTVKYNEAMTKYADLVTNYNTLVTRFENYQKEVKEMLAKQKESGK